MIILKNKQDYVGLSQYSLARINTKIIFLTYDFQISRLKKSDILEITKKGKLL
jgi:hypothetical protein